MTAPPSDLRADIDTFVAELLAGSSPRLPPDDKVVHDPIWGTHRFRRHEVALIDSPVLQRLRRIYQTGFSFFAYPSTTQTRFEHSLGAAVVATRMLEAVAQRHPSALDMDPYRGDLATVRVAALLHDCGHGFASHASEQLYQWHPAVREALTTVNDFKNARASEVLTWYIVTSPAFRGLLEAVNEQSGTALDADRIAGLILGRPYDHRDFLAEVLSGPFDVDRIDYTVRDADYSGLKAAIDLERFFHDLDVSLLPDQRPHLVLRSTHAIEQLLWAKVHLFVRVYRHQKVLAADALVQSLVEVARAEQVRFRGVDFTNVSDYLRLTDIDILGSDPKGMPAALSGVLDKFRHRDLPHRAIVISPESLHTGGADGRQIHDIRRLAEMPEGLGDLRREIWERIQANPRPAEHSILLAIPPALPLREASRVYVMLRGQDEPKTLNRVFKIDEWLGTYSDAHWAGYVFADREATDVVARAAIEALEARGVRIDGRLATARQRAPSPTVVPLAQGGRPRVQPVDSSALFDVADQLPVLQEFVRRRVASVAPGPLSGLHAVLILHFLTDLPPLLARLAELGLEPDRTWLVRKPYAYSFAHELTTKLRSDRYHVEECTAAESPHEPARRVLQELRVRLAAHERFLVIEDGGYVTPLLHGRDFDSLREQCLGVVEQTTKGLREIEGVAGLQVPVIAVARSQLKRHLEAAEVGDALTFAIETYFRRMRGASLHRVGVLVVGFGAVGESLATALALRGCKVAVYDADRFLRTRATVTKSAHFEVLENLDDLGHFQLIVGTTGKTSIAAEALLKAADGIVLASGSSDRLEFDLSGLLAHVAEPVDQHVELAGLETRFRLRNGRSIAVLCDGYPINFVIGDGIAKSVIDPILTELVAGALLLADGSHTSPGVQDLPSETEQEILDLYNQP